MLPYFLASVLCQVIVIPADERPVHVAPFPAGTCVFCCPIDLDRDIHYQLYTRRNPSKADILKPNNSTSLQNSNFDPDNPTVVYIHGYSESSAGTSAITIRDAYLKRGKYNVILVNWSKLAALPWYVTAVQNTRTVGSHVAFLVTWLDAMRAVSLSKIHVIGFSLGAEIAGFMGKALAPRKIGRITGLDAAYPLYMNTGTQGHLTATDASFVDVIHTDGGTLGFPNPLGHADFYPNGGGPPQPGCGFRNAFQMRISKLINHNIICGHNRAWRFYAESVTNPTGFAASRCKRWHPGVRANCTWTPDAIMGFAAHSETKGIFYLRTNAHPPFARNTTGYAR